MLVLGRKVNQQAVLIATEDMVIKAGQVIVEVTLIDTSTSRTGTARIGFDAPQEIRIVRPEAAEKQVSK